MLVVYFCGNSNTGVGVGSPSMLVVYQGWDCSVITQISVEHKLKSIVDDDHFRG